jgi:uncharacterized metal-binding protein YceD (DUF177 family)
VKNNVTQCIIPLASLKKGEHNYLFTVDGELFTENQYDDIHEATLKVTVTFDKNSSIFMFNFLIEGTVNVTCDRCGDDFNMEIYLKRQLIVKTGTSIHQEEDDMISLANDEGELDIAPYIYQYVVLSLPMQKLHQADVDGNRACNPEVLKKLKNLNVEHSSEEQYILNSNKHFSHKEKPTNN